MKFIILDNILTRMLNVLEGVGKFINELPTEEETKKMSTSPKLRRPLWKKTKTSTPKVLKQKPSKEINTFKGSGYNGKGKINTDAATFNHPRKSVSQGRRH